MMDLEFDDDQRALLDALDRLLTRHAGARKAASLTMGDGSGAVEYDAAPERALADAGFLDVLAPPNGMLLEALLVVEAAARHAVTAPIGTRAIVAKGLELTDLPGPVVIVEQRAGSVVRFGGQAATFLYAEGGDVLAVDPAEATVSPLPSRWGFPLAEVTIGPGRRVRAGGAEDMSRLWRMALAAEVVGTLRAVLDLTLAYVRDRRQFGRPIGSFQAVQHRLAEGTVLVEGARYLTYEAAWKGADRQAAATALTQAAAAADLMLAEAHQLHGSMGFTSEYDLTVFTTRLHALRGELGGSGALAREVTVNRWRNGTAPAAVDTERPVGAPA